MISNDKVESEGRKREYYEVLNAVAGALALWAGLEAVANLL